MSEVLLPPWIVPQEESHEWLDEGSSVFAAAFAPGLAQRQSYGGLRLKLSRRHTVRGEEKAQLLSILKSTRGRYNAIRTKVHFALRGSFSTTELFSNNTFASGTTGWTSTSDYSHSLAERMLRATRVAVTGVPDALVNSSAVTVTQFAPYALRFMINQGRGSYTNTFELRVGATSGATTYGRETGLAYGGLHSMPSVPYGTSAYGTLLDGMSSGLIYGDYFSVPYASLARCALVDDAPNLLRRSDEFDNAVWTLSEATVTANFATAPDGTTTADRLVEAATTNQHYLNQNITGASAVTDYALICAMKADGRNFGWLSLTEGTGSTEAYQLFNLSTGAVGTSTATGANWASLRAFISPMGNGWYFCCIVVRKTNAATNIIANIGISSTDSRGAYLGSASATGTIQLWRGTLAASAVPSRLSQTTSAASTSGTAQSGNGLYLKGLVASTDGLLLPGDWFEINGELKQCASALNSNAAGLGFIQFESALIRSPSDGDPLIIADPMGKFLVSNIRVENEFGIQARVSYDLEHIYE